MENFNIIEERENSLFKRKEVKFTIDAKITPSHVDARKFISEKFSTSEKNIRVKNILGKFGSRNFTISAHIYESEQDKLDTEGESKKDRPGQSEQEVAAQSAPVAPTNTSISESPKSEEPKPEEKTE